MKYLIFILIGVLTATTLVAQPMVTLNSQIPGWTENYLVNFTEVSDNFDPGNSGPNQLWDFTSLPTPDSLSLGNSYAIVGPISLGDNYENYMDADFIWILGGEEKRYDFYYAYEGDNMRLLASESFEEPSGDLISKTVYSQGESALQFPITFNTTYNYSSTFIRTVSGNSTSGSRTGTVTADGYGTIITPYGTFEDVIRLVNSSSEPGGFTEVQYTWIEFQTFVPLLIYTSNSDPEVADNVYYSEFGGITSTREAVYDYGLIIAGNPLRDQIQLAGDLEQLPKLEFQVINQLGQPLEAQLETDQISLTDGPAGVYYLILIGEHGRQLLPFIRQ